MRKLPFFLLPFLSSAFPSRYFFQNEEMDIKASSSLTPRKPSIYPKDEITFKADVWLLFVLYYWNSPLRLFFNKGQVIETFRSSAHPTKAGIYQPAIDLAIKKVGRLSFSVFLLSITCSLPITPILYEKFLCRLCLNRLKGIEVAMGIPSWLAFLFGLLFFPSLLLLSWVYNS